MATGDMTLADWADQYRTQPGFHSSGAWWVPIQSQDALNALFWLSDYRVTSVHGGSAWLAPR